MKRRYQIDQQRAVQQFRRLATEQNPNIQMILPMADIVGLLQEGVGNLLRHAGLELMHLVMDEEAKWLAGERHQQHEQCRGHRRGTENGHCVVGGPPCKDRQMIAALGIGCDGRKTVLGIREGATENTAVVSSLLSELVERGLDFSTPRLYILDGGKALHAAVRRHAGEAAFIQRCQVHKKRNVVDHLPDEHKAEVKRKLQNAYAMTDYADAKRALDRLHRELMDLNPSAARSLEEGMEETLTVHRLRVPDSGEM